MLSGVIGQKLVKTHEDVKQELLEKQNKVKLQLLRIQNYKLNKIREYNNIIPLKIFQTWHTKNLPERMKKAVEHLKRMHPRFEHHLFDDDDCREFIAKNFNADVLNAFDRLIPGAYKADLWRYCILYIHGGIYVDIKYDCINSFRFIELTEREHWVFDINKNDVYNALIVSMPKNELLLRCINQIVENVKNNYYGNSCIDPTGPGLVGRLMNAETKQKIELEHIHNKFPGDKFILYRNVAILKMYNGYYNELGKNQKAHHYSILWHHRQIYK